MKSYAFVVPRFGESVGGGAETLAAAVAMRLAKRGDRVEVWTTCAVDNRTWENHFPPGEASEYGLTVRRFPVDPRNLDVWIPLQIRISEGMMTSVEEQLAWMSDGVNSSQLYLHIENHSAEFDAVFFAPYLFGTTFFGSLVKPERSVLIPCLHDEYYAYCDIINSMFRQVRGALFNAEPERELTQRLYGPIKGAEVGMGFDLYPEDEVQNLAPMFDFPYLLYVGRKETGKNVQTLIDHFCAFKESYPAHSDLRLVIVGGGSFEDLLRPQAKCRGDIVDLSQASELDKRRLIRHAMLLCQPSSNESFSIVIMEAWLLGTPVLVNGHCAVTHRHVLDSGGGLYFRDFADFAGAVGSLLVDSGLRERLGAAGLEYVKSKYNWDAVIERFDRTIAGL